MVVWRRELGKKFIRSRFVETFEITTVFPMAHYEQQVSEGGTKMPKRSTDRGVPAEQFAERLYAMLENYRSHKGDKRYIPLNMTEWNRRKAETKRVVYNCQFCKKYDYDQRCCSGCANSYGYFYYVCDVRSEKQIKKLVALWDRELGFWRKDGCCLPRYLRSQTCLLYECWMDDASKRNLEDYLEGRDFLQLSLFKEYEIVRIPLAKYVDSAKRRKLIWGERVYS